MRRTKTAWIAVLLLGVCGTLFAEVKTWQTGAGAWQDPANWDAGVPVAGDDVVITNAGASVLLDATTPVLHSLTLGGSLVFTNWSTALQADIVNLEDGGIMTLPAAFADTQMSNRVWIVCSNLTLAAGGRIDVDGKGYVGGDGAIGSNGAGPGGGQGGTSNRGGGGGYGGRGGWGIYSTGAWSPWRGGSDYGMPENPDSPGSGGGALKITGSGGGSGGGTVKIEATGDVMVNGLISANGADALNYSGGGSGGGVKIACDRFGGTGGQILANGGAGSHDGGGGGGGRIAIAYQDLVGSPAVRFEARESPGTFPMWDPIDRWDSHWLSEYGTVWFSDSRMLSTTLDYVYGTVFVPGLTTWAPASLTVSNGVAGLEPGVSLQVAGNLRVGADGALELAQRAGFEAGGDVTLDGGRLVMNVFTQMTFGADLALSNGGRLYAYSAPTNGSTPYGATIDVAGDIRIGPGSWILPDADYTNGGPVRIRCANADIAANGGIDADSRGFSGGFLDGQDGWGPGAGQKGTGAPNYGSGAGYGGQGGWGWYNDWGLSGGAAYGVTNAPVMPGSGGGSFGGQYGGNGGGTIWLEAGNRIALDGLLTADAGLPRLYSGGGSGGGIFLSAQTFEGGSGGKIRADGSDAGDRGGPGGGGRIAVVLGVDSAAREQLIAGNSLPGLYAYDLHADYAGALEVGVGSGPDYTGEEWRAPGEGTYVFLTTNTALNIIGDPGNFGHPAPDGYGGCPDYPAGTWITNGVLSPDDEAAGVRHACLGWVLTDENETIVDFGTSTQTVFQLTATRMLTWRWTNEYHLAVQEGLGGTVTTERSGWYTNDTVVTGIEGSPDPGYVFDRWVGDVPEEDETTNPLSVTMDRPRTLIPVFASVTGQDKNWSGGEGVWEDPDNWSPAGIPGLYDRVVITSGTAIVNYSRQTASVVVSNGAALLFTNWVASLTVSNLTVGPAGVITLPPPFTESGMSNRVSIVCTNLTIDAGGAIDVTGKGYAGGYNGADGHGPGKGLGDGHGGGGGHGGVGGCGQVAGGGVYDAPEDPTAPGSGGGTFPHANSRGSAGGGVVGIRASGDVIVDGTIAANGGTGAEYYGGGGSGGAVSIVCKRFGGDGIVSANGGAPANTGGGGGGGRLAIDYQALIGTPGVRIEAREATSQWPRWSSELRWSQYLWAAEPGTLHFNDPTLLRSEITHLYGQLSIPDFNTWMPANLTVSNALLKLPPEFNLHVTEKLTLGSEGALELMENSTLRSDGDVTLNGGRLVMNVFTQMTFGADLALSNGGRLYAYSAPTNGNGGYGATVKVTGEIQVGPESWILPDASPTNGAGVRFLARKVFIAEEGGFNADGRGFLGGWLTINRRGFGPGCGEVDNCGPGAGHGGKGGDAWEVSRWGAAGGPSYGNAYGPLGPGSGGGCFRGGTGGHGGGLIWIEAEDSVRLEGLLHADGGLSKNFSGGGSGGGIFVCAPRFSGGAEARLRANGSGGSQPPRGGPGGGGRIVVAVGLSASERSRLLAGEAPRLREELSHASFTGSLEVTPSLTGPDYTGEEWRAPSSGTALFLKSIGNTLIIIR